jgi:hypothetical protein
MNRLIRRVRQRVLTNPGLSVSTKRQGIQVEVFAAVAHVALVPGKDQRHLAQ